jgi:hypothetical protein
MFGSCGGAWIGGRDLVGTTGGDVRLDTSGPIVVTNQVTLAHAAILPPAVWFSDSPVATSLTAVGGTNLASVLRSGALRNILDGAGEQAELIAFGIGEHNPGGDGCLAHVDPLSTQIQKAAKFIALGGSICTKVEMKSVLHGLFLGHASDIDGWPRTVRWPQVRPGGIEIVDLPTKDSTPELGHSAGIDGIDRNGCDPACHALVLHR